MTEKIILGMWRNAPFQGAIISSVDRLNSFLEEQNIDMEYDIMHIAPEQLSDNMTLPNVFILDGGEDVNPARYGEENRYSYFSETRDEIEFGFAEFMANHKVRMSGVCRGHQLLNVFLGGTLWQDIRRDGCVPEDMKHSSGHKVKVGGGRGTSPRKNLPISDFIGRHSFCVSSLHHQSINYFGKNVYPTLVWEVSKDNYHGRSHGYVIEGIETNNSMIRAVQSHPEFKGYPKDGLLFAYLMYVDYFLSPVFKITDEEIKHKFRSLIKSKKAEKRSQANNYTDRLRNSSRSMNAEQLRRTLTRPRGQERD